MLSSLSHSHTLVYLHMGKLDIISNGSSKCFGVWPADASLRVAEQTMWKKGKRQGQRETEMDQA